MAKARGNDPGARWRIGPEDRVDLGGIDTRSTAGAPGAKEETSLATEALYPELADLQRRLYAEGERSLLLVLQAMDAGGKDGTVRNVFRGMNPLGVRVHAFKVPTEHELAHDFLWRVHDVVPRKGEIGVFNRSHYEDVLVVRVKEIVPESVWRPRFDHIRAFEELLADAGTTIVKVFLHISKEEQRERLQARLDDPDKRWKFNVADLEERARWDAYQEAFAEAIEETSTRSAPWYVVPADRKWYRDWAVMQILVGTLRHLDPRYPEPDDLTGVTVD